MLNPPRFVIALAVLAAAAFLAACLPSSDDGGDPGDDPGVVVIVATPENTSTSRPRRTEEPTPTPSPTPLQVCGPNPDPAPPNILAVEGPLAGQNVKVPFHVRGWGSNIGFEDQGVALAIVDATQTVRQVLDLPPQPREFRIVPAEHADHRVHEAVRSRHHPPTNVSGPTPFCLWVYQQTNEEGQPRGVVQVPIIVSP